jgi:hypothetical protein
LNCAQVKVAAGEAKGKVLYVAADEVVRYQAAPATPEPGGARKAGKTKNTKAKKSAPGGAAKAKGTAAKTAADPGARASSLLKLGQSLEKAGKTAGAIEFYRQVLKEFPESTAAKVAGERLRALAKP